MSQKNNEQSNKVTSVEDKLYKLVSVYHKAFKEYENTYDKLSVRNDVLEKLKPYIQKGNFNSEDSGIKEILKEYLLIYAQYPQDVSFYANKFMNAADVFLNTSDRQLKDEISSDYLRLKKTEYKPNFSIENGDFVRNKDSGLPQIPDEQFEILFNSIKSIL